MSIKETVEGYSVIMFVSVGEPAIESWRQSVAPTAEDGRRRAEEIKALIERHIRPQAQFDTAIDIEPQINRRCEHCGARWTETSRDYNGGCCAKDEEPRAGHMRVV